MEINKFHLVFFCVGKGNFSYSANNYNNTDNIDVALSHLIENGPPLYNNGTPLLYIKDFLGYSNITTTEIYATPDSKKQRGLILNNAKEIKTKTTYSDSKKETLDNWLKNNMY